MGGQLEPFDGPALAVQLGFGQAGKERADLSGGLLVVEIPHARPHPRRIGDDVVFERDGKIDQLARHIRDPLRFHHAPLFACIATR